MNNTSLLFTVTAHESYTAINELTYSILNSYSNSHIILHINKLWYDFDESKINHINTKVFVNKDKRYPLYDRMNGKTGIHISNIEYANKISIPYDYVILCASNEIYIKKIQISHIEKNKYGSDFLCVSKDSKYYESIPHPDSTFINGVIGNSLNFISTKNGIFGGRHEGMFFTKEIAHELIQIYRKHFYDSNNLCRCDEEIIPHTILYNLTQPSETESICHFSNRAIDYNLIQDFYYETIVDFSDLFTKYDQTTKDKFSIKGIGRNDVVLRGLISKLLNS